MDRGDLTVSIRLTAGMSRPHVSHEFEVTLDGWCLSWLVVALLLAGWLAWLVVFR